MAPARGMAEMTLVAAEEEGTEATEVAERHSLGDDHGLFFFSNEGEASSKSDGSTA